MKTTNKIENNNKLFDFLKFILKFVNTICLFGKKLSNFLLKTFC